MRKRLIEILVCAWLINLLPAYNYAQQVSQDSEIKIPVDMVENDEDQYLDIPPNYTTVIVDWGITLLQNAPRSMDLTFWRSRVFGGSLYYNIPIGKSHLMASFGVGVANADYLFKSENILDRLGTGENRKTTIRSAKRLVTGSTEIQKTMFSINHIDFIGEIRFNANKEEPQDGFFIAVGGSIGFQFSPATSIYYKEDKQNKVRITKETFNVKKYRYGIITKIGWSRFGIFYKHTLSGLFDDNGPSQNTILPFSVGISINMI